MSSPTEPVGMVPISGISPPDSGMMAPLPNCFSIAAIAPATAFIFSLMLDMSRSFFRRVNGSECGLVEHAVLEGFGEVDGAYGRAPIEVGDGARDAPDAGDGARRQAETRGGALEQLVPGGIDRCDLREGHRRQAGVGGSAAHPLPISSLRDAIPDQGGRFTGLGVGERVIRQRRD